MTYLILVAFVVLWVSVGCIQWRKQRNAWNGGICAASGLPWIQFDQDSQGGRMFKDGAGNYLTLDWFRSTVTASGCQDSAGEKHE